MEKIQIIGIDELDEKEIEIVNKLANEYYDKIQREIKNITSLVIHIKKLSKSGSKPKYTLHTRAVAPTRMFETDKSSDWDLARTLHKGFKDLERQIQHRLHSDDQHD